MDLLPRPPRRSIPVAPLRACVWHEPCEGWYASSASARGKEQMDERCGKPGQDVVRRRGRDLLRQPRHLRDALRSGPRPGRGLALRARVGRGGGGRRGRAAPAAGGGGGLRGGLGWAEGVVTGAADGYARMAEKPASTLLHLGPGLANGLANVHNAKRANTPMVNVVGDHATYHKKYDAPLASDVEGAARPFSHWVKTSTDSRSGAAGGAGARAAAVARPGLISPRILPADASWNEADGPARPRPVEERASAAPESIS